MPHVSLIFDSLFLDAANTQMNSRFLYSFVSLSIFREALHAWRKRARGTTVVAAERLRDLFEELNFCPTEKQSKCGRNVISIKIQLIFVRSK